MEYEMNNKKKMFSFSSNQRCLFACFDVLLGLTFAMNLWRRKIIIIIMIPFTDFQLKSTRISKISFRVCFQVLTLLSNLMTIIPRKLIWQPPLLTARTVASKAVYSDEKSKTIGSNCKRKFTSLSLDHNSIGYHPLPWGPRFAFHASQCFWIASWPTAGADPTGERTTPFARKYDAHRVQLDCAPLRASTNS